MSVLDAAVSGDRRRVLEALRDRLAAAIDEGPEPKDLAALCLRLERVVGELESLPVVGGGMTWEERLEARRKAKKTANG